MKRYRIGRADTNEIVLEEPSVSREHAELVKVNRGVFLLRDLSSTFGTSARQGADWHLVTAENVTYDTPIRIGEFETTVAELLREVDPLAVYMEAPPAPPWAAPEARLSEDERALHPETTHVGWGPAGEPPRLFQPQRPATPDGGLPRHPLAVVALIGLGLFAVAMLVGAGAALG
jgi:hypothetical protein